MDTQTDEIAPGIYRFSTLVTLGNGKQLPFNQFLIKGEQPMRPCTTVALGARAIH